MENSTSCAPSPNLEDLMIDEFLEWDQLSSILDTSHLSSNLANDGLDQTERETKLVKTNSPSKKRKKLADQKYRQRCKDRMKITEAAVDYLRDQLRRLLEENEILKMENLNKNNVLQSQEEMIRQLKQNFHQLKTQYQSQSTIVRVISEKLYSASDVDLQKENANLKKQIDLSMNFSDNPNKLEIFRLEQEKAELERQTRVLKVIVEALCEKIHHHHETQQGQQQLL